MSDENQAGINLRLTQLAAATGVAGNDLETLVATEYPNGALAFCNDVATLYRLDKFSTLTVANPSIVSAIGGGRWIALGSSLETLFSAMVQWTVVAGSAVTLGVQSQWTALPSSASNFSVVTGANAALWSASTTSGVLTYAGPTRNFLIQAQLTASAATGTTTNMGFGFSRSSAAIIGGTTNPLYEAQQECAATEERTWSITAVVADLAAAETIQGCVRNNDGTENLTILRYTMAITPFG